MHLCTSPEINERNAPEIALIVLESKLATPLFTSATKRDFEYSNGESQRLKSRLEG